MIFNYYSRVAVKLGDGERYVFDRARLMYTEVAEIEKVTGLSYMEWEQQLRKFSITALAALLHVLRRREGKSSDFGSMQFNAADLEVVPVHEDGSEMSPAQIAADLAARIKKAQDEQEPDPTPAADGTAATSPEDGSGRPISGPSTSDGSASYSGSARGNGSTSPTLTSSQAKPTAIAG